jgi:hypothetical protein
MGMGIKLSTSAPEVDPADDASSEVNHLVDRRTGQVLLKDPTGRYL